jgi:hypothetical protein
MRVINPEWRRYYANLRRERERLGKGRHTKIQVTEYSGKKKEITVKTSVPKKCSTPRRICLSCQKQSIHKNSKLYDLKICQSCFDQKA